MTARIDISPVDVERLIAQQVTGKMLAVKYKCNAKTICRKLKDTGDQRIIDALRKNSLGGKFRKNYAGCRKAAEMVLRGEKIAVIELVTGCSTQTISRLRSELSEILQYVSLG